MTDPIQPSDPLPVVHQIDNPHVLVTYCGAKRTFSTLDTEDPGRVTCPDCDPATPGRNVQASITVRQDVGGHYPSYKYVTLDLHTNGTVTWRDLTYDH